MTDLVECASGFTYAEKPVALYWEGRRLEVETIESIWRDPYGRAFRVSTREGRRFELHYSEKNDEWQVKLINS